MRLRLRCKRSLLPATNIKTSCVRRAESRRAPKTFACQASKSLRRLIELPSAQARRAADILIDTNKQTNKQTDRQTDARAASSSRPRLCCPRRVCVRFERRRCRRRVVCLSARRVIARRACRERRAVLPTGRPVAARLEKSNYVDCLFVCLFVFATCALRYLRVRQITRTQTHKQRRQA